MRKLIVVIIMLTVQFNYGQEDYSKYKPVEPLYDNGGISNFFDYLSRTIDLSKVQKEDNVIIAFILDSNGKMNHIKVGFCTNLEAEKEITTALQNAKSWDMTNQKDKDYFIRYKIKLIFSENKVAGLTKTSWLKEDQEDINIDKGEFLSYESSSKKDKQVNGVTTYDKKPEYPGGITAFNKLFTSNFNSNGSIGYFGGRIMISFVVESDGSLADIKVIRNENYRVEREVIRVLKLGKKWIPAEKDGVKVRCSYLLPLEID